MDATLRGRGIGARLVAALHARGAASGATSAALQVLDGNPARRLYERPGYAVHHAYRYRTEPEPLR